MLDEILIRVYWWVSMGSCFLAWVVNEEGKVKVGSEEDGEGEERVVMRCCRELVNGEVLMRGTR